MGYQNFYASRLTTDIGTSDTSIAVETAPSQTSGRMVLEARNPTQREIISYTNVSGTTLTGVTRGEGGTTAKTHTRNALIEMNLTAEDISDLYAAFAAFEADNTNWFEILDSVSSVTANGNRSYDLVFNGVDLTDTISPGMRLQLTRTVAAPDQCTSLNGSTQYWSKSSPAGMTFTDDFSVSAWVYLTSYGALSSIASRYNGTSGWRFFIDTDGTVKLHGHNASSANYSRVSSYQSIPLNRWVHVAAQLDMSAYTATTTTSYVMIDGVNVPALVFRSGTNPTALVQAGNLEVGTENGVNFFPGKIAQVAIYSAKVTQATHLAAMNQGLSGSETSLISAYSFDGVATDLNANANDLSASGSATATEDDSPFENYGAATNKEYAIVMKAAFSTNTTLTVQVPEGCAIPTSGGVDAVFYSTQSVPYGFPKDAGKWELIVCSMNSDFITIGAINNWTAASNVELKVPIGRWKLSYQFNAQLHSTASGARNGCIALRGSTYLATANGSYVNPTIGWLPYHATIADTIGNVYREHSIEMDTSDTFAIAASIKSASGTESWVPCYGKSLGFIKAGNNYL